MALGFTRLYSEFTFINLIWSTLASKFDWTCPNIWTSEYLLALLYIENCRCLQNNQQRAINLNIGKIECRHFLYVVTRIYKVKLTLWTFYSSTLLLRNIIFFPIFQWSNFNISITISLERAVWKKLELLGLIRSFIRGK